MQMGLYRQRIYRNCCRPAPLGIALVPRVFRLPGRPARFPDYDREPEGWKANRGWRPSR